MKNINLSLIFIIVMIMAGCGGGGSSTTPTSDVAATIAAPVTTCTNGGTNFPTCTAPSASNIVTTVPAATYAAGSPAATMFTQINSLRASIGSGLLAQNAKLDTSVNAHMNYLNLNGNNGVSWHDETSGLPGFFGVDPQTRATTAGYVGSAGEVIASIGIANDGSWCTSEWENSVYHIGVLFYPAFDAGISVGNLSGNLTGFTMCIFDYGSPMTAGGNSMQLPATGSVLAFPFAGMTNVATSFNNQAETPVPVPDLNGIGHPVTVSLSTNGANAPKVAVTLFTITPQSGATAGVAVATRILVPTGTTTNGPILVVDPEIAVGTVALIPITALSTNTVYAVVFTATVNGSTVTKSWSFTTGAQ